LKAARRRKVLGSALPPAERSAAAL